MSADRCPHRIALDVERRPGNALNVEIGTPIPRCKLKPPHHWPTDGKRDEVFVWLRSGGTPLVLGRCNSACPLTADKKAG